MAVYIVSAARTPIGSFNESFSSVSAADLGAVAIKEVLKRANVNGGDVDEIIMGQTLTAGAGQNTAKQAAWSAGIPQHVPAYVINMLCGSGVKSIVLGWQSILCGHSKIVICGGQECMSQAPHYIRLRNSTAKLGPSTLDDTLLRDGLHDAKYDIHMGVTAENIAQTRNISRKEQDAFAAKSQQLTEIAQKNGYFNEEIVPVSVTSVSGTTTIVDKDEYPRHGTTEKILSQLEAKFVKDGTVTAGNATGINDSAAAVLLMSENETKQRGLKPLAKIVGYSQGCVDPKMMGLGPAAAIPKLLKTIGWTVDDVDLYEINEAYAAASLAVNRECGINPDKVNVHGGTIALGHPLAASGTRILTTLIYALKRTGSKKGVASLCIGGGMGIAIAIEMV